MNRTLLLTLCVWGLGAGSRPLAAQPTPRGDEAAPSRQPIPDRLVVLTFDDSSRSHYTVVRPLLKQFGFSATFFITEGFDFVDNKRDYMTWEQIAELHRDGFEIGNHTRDHLGLTDDNVSQVLDQLDAINRRCAEWGIPKTTSFAWPGNSTSLKALPLLKQAGIRWARRGGAPEKDYDSGQGYGYEPGLDHPLLIPSAGDARPNWKLDDLIRAVEQAREGRIAVLQFHGTPDTAHDWVSTASSNFAAFLKYLKFHDYQVVAMRDLDRFVDSEIVPNNPQEVIEDRRRMEKLGWSRDNSRPPRDPADLHYWLANMRRHAFAPQEMAWATGLPVRQVTESLKQLEEAPADDPHRLTMLPYPGGRHPRIGFLDGAMRPQRETKFSVFLPWDPASYVVVDLPEAIWHDRQPARELLYLAHTHVPTRWSKDNIQLPPLEWNRVAPERLTLERRLPSGVILGAEAVAEQDRIMMRLWLDNQSSEHLRGLNVQTCVMLKQAAGFAQQDNANKLLRAPVAACHDASGKRWIITAWESCQRAWGNTGCPCLHADPQFADCPPGAKVELRGWLGFYEGDDVEEYLAKNAIPARTASQ